MKRVIYSAYTKTVAILLVVICVLLSVSVLMDGFVKLNNSGDLSVYHFEDNFGNSEYASELLSVAAVSVYSSYLEEDKDAVESVQLPDDGEAVNEESSQTNKEENEFNYSAQKGRLSYIESSLGKYDFLKYFIQINDEVITNCEADDKTDLMNGRYYSVMEKDITGHVSFDSTVYRNYYNYIYDISNLTDDVITVCAQIKQSSAVEYENQWNRQAAIVRDAFSLIALFAVLALLLLIYLVFAAGKNSKNEFKSLWIDSLWTEVHLAAAVISAFCAIGLCVIMLDEVLLGYLSVYIAKSVLTASIIALMIVILTALLSAVRKIKCGTFISGSLIYKVSVWVWRKRKKILNFVFSYAKEFFKVMINAASNKTGLLLIGLLFIYTSIIGLFGIITPFSPIGLLFAFAVFTAACYVIVNRSKDIDEIKHAADEIRSGNLSYKVQEVKSQDLKQLAANMNEIAMGLNESFSAKLKAERMKTDLITNVSHDLKTPLTSIISYTELLSNLENLPEEARDYVKIIAKKSDRLKNLTQDLFDISKVQSGNENIIFERLDVALLINQSLGEHDSEIQNSQLKFCVDIAKELYISADGRKMSRVVSNLISNILKYTMKNTRVFISARESEDEIILEFKNISSYPMEFDAEEITGRFVRGDESRTAEGNGLGLAIAKGYTEACNGKFEVVLDGDMFKAIIHFNKY